MECVLFSRPNHDNTMAYLHYYSSLLIDLPKQYGLKTINKEGEDANKKVVSNIIKEFAPKLIMFNGHGSSKAIFGHHNELLVSSEENPEILSKTITYALACSSARELGVEACKKGAIAFIGYIDEFSLGKDPDSEATPKRDRIAKLFLEPSNLLFSSLIKGNKAIDAVVKAKKKILENVWFLNTTDSFPEAPYYAPYLFYNFLYLDICGDQNASI